MSACGDDLHRVEETLLLADLLGIARVPEIVPPRAPDIARRPQPYAVLHAAPFFRYKQWHADGWRALARFLAERGLQVVATGGPGERERRYLDEVWNQAPGRRAARRTPELAGADRFVDRCANIHRPRYLGNASRRGVRLSDRRAVRPDRSAAVGTLAGRGPARALAAKRRRVQRRGHVWLVQNPLPGMPCGLEGCLRHTGSH